MGLTTNGLPAAAASGNKTVAVVTTPDGGLVWTSWELGGSGSWQTIQTDKSTDVAPAVSFRTTVGGGAMPWLGIKDRSNGEIYETFIGSDGSLNGWTLIPGMVTNVSPAVSDGNLVLGVPIMVAVSTNSESFVNIFLNDQPPYPPPSDYWQAITKAPLTSMAPAIGLVGNRGNYMFLASTVPDSVGPNNHLMLYQGSPYNPGVPANVSSMNFESNVSPAMASANDRTVIVAVDPNGNMFYDWWDLGGGGHGWKPLGNEVQTKVAPAISLVDKGKYMFIFAQGMNGELWINQGGPSDDVLIGWLPAE